MFQSDATGSLPHLRCCMESMSRYKQTELGLLPEDWDIHSLDAVCGTIKTGKLDANAMRAEGEYPFFTCARDHYWIDQYAFDAEALLVSRNGANVGYVHYYNGKFNAYQRTYVLYSFSADIRYIKLFLQRHLQERLRGEVNAGNTPYIVRDTLAKMAIALPHRPAEQRAIAAALSDVDALIGALDRLIAKKRDLKQAAMQQLLTGQTRLPGFSDEWEEQKLGSRATFRTGPFGSALHKADYTLDGVPVVNPMHIVDGRIVPTSTMTVTEHAAEKLADFRLKMSDVVIGRRGDMGRCAVVLEHQAGWLCGTGSMIVRSTPDLSPAFLQRVLSSPPIIAAIEESSVGTTMVNLNQKVLAGLNIAFPSFDEQAAIATVIGHMDLDLAVLEHRRDKTRLLKQGMMQELLTGRIRLV